MRSLQTGLQFAWSSNELIGHKPSGQRQRPRFRILDDTVLVLYEYVAVGTDGRPGDGWLYDTVWLWYTC